MKNIIFCLITFLYLNFVNAQNFRYYSEEIKKSLNTDDELKIISVAESGLLNFLQLIPIGKEFDYGFNNREEFSNCKIGKPIAVITLSHDFFETQEIDSLKSYFIQNNEWRIPILLNNKLITFLTVTKNKYGYELVDLGGSQLAQNIQGKMNEYSFSNYALLRVYQLFEDFLFVNDLKSSINLNFLPLQSAHFFLNTSMNNKKIYYSPFELLTLIKLKLKP